MWWSRLGQEAPVYLHPQLMPSLRWLKRWWRRILTPPCLFLFLSTRSIADWLKPPDTWFLLDFIKPEFLLLRVGVPFYCVYLSIFQFSNLLVHSSLSPLRSSPHSQTLARCIIMWDEILPNTEWVKSNIPQVRKYTYTQHYCSDIFCCCCDNILFGLVRNKI